MNTTTSPTTGTAAPAAVTPSTAPIPTQTWSFTGHLDPKRTRAFPAEDGAPAVVLVRLTDTGRGQVWVWNAEALAYVWTAREDDGGRWVKVEPGFHAAGAMHTFLDDAILAAARAGA